MSSVIITKEELTAFERWELASFDLNQGLKRRISAQEAAAELERIRQQAYDEGKEQGREAGYAAGVQQVRSETAQIHTLMQDLHNAINRVDEQLAQSLLDLSMEIAQKMIGEKLQVNPEIILKIVGDAIGSLPHFNQNAHLILHHDDAELVRKHMGEQLVHGGWKIFADTKIKRGGCRVETSHSQVDATMEARWKHIVESIGRDKSWQA
jgi:flagellar assembly protein FliH